MVGAVLSLFLLVTKRLYGKEGKWSRGQKKTCRKKQHVKIDNMKEMSDLICGKAAVGGNNNSTRDRIAAMDFIGSGVSVRFAPDRGTEDADSEEECNKRKLRKDIARIVRNAEERSKTTCEWCGDMKTASLRTDLGVWVCTLCDSCVGKYIEKREQHRMELEEKRNEIFEKLKSNGEESD